MNSTNILVICYPPESGGKFIGNCLALSNSFYFQDESLMRQQIAGQLPPSKKLELLLNRLAEVDHTWNDLNMGDGQLQTRNWLTKDYRLSVELGNGNTWWFQCTHEHEDLALLTKYWPRHKRVFLTNANEFVNYRYGLDQKVDRSSYPHLHQDYVIGNDRVGYNDFEWNVNSFFSVDAFVEQIYNLYVVLNLNDFDKDLLTQYYHAWFATVTRLRTTKEKMIHVHGPSEGYRMFESVTRK